MLQGLQAVTLFAEVFWEFCKHFQIINFAKHLWATDADGKIAIEYQAVGQDYMGISTEALARMCSSVERLHKPTTIISIL